MSGFFPAEFEQISTSPNGCSRSHWHDSSEARSLQQPLEDVDGPVADEIPVVGHGTLPVGVTVLCTVLGNGPRPPVPSSVDPMGTPTRPMPDREPLPGDEADAPGLEDAVVPPAHVPEAVPDMPALSNRAVGAEVPPVAT